MPNQYLKVKLPVPPSANDLHVWDTRLSTKRKVRRSDDYKEWLDEVRFKVEDAIDGLDQEVKDRINKHGPAITVYAALREGYSGGIDLDNSLKAIIDVFQGDKGLKLKERKFVYKDDNTVERISTKRIPLKPGESPYVLVVISPNYWEETTNKLSGEISVTFKGPLDKPYPEDFLDWIKPKIFELEKEYSQGTVQNLSPGVERSSRGVLSGEYQGSVW